MRAERDEARAEYDRARAEFEAARAQLPAIEEEFRSLQERLSNAHSEVRARLAERDAVPRERPGHRSDRDPSGSGQLSELARSTAPPLPEGRPRHSYRNGAILSHMAHVNKTYKAGFKDDGRHMFFQFEMAPEEGVV